LQQIINDSPIAAFLFICLLALFQTPPNAGAGSDISPLAQGASASSIPATPPLEDQDDWEEVASDRELEDECPREGCSIPLFLKENIRKDKADYPACRRFKTGRCSWTGLQVRYRGKTCWFCCSEFDIGRVVWAYRLPGNKHIYPFMLLDLLIS